MTKADEKAARERRLATKLRENLKRRKQQARARATDDKEAPPSVPPETSQG